MSKIRERPIPEIDGDKKKYITQKYLQKICDYNGQFYTSCLVDTLYLSCVGFRKIENLEEYYDVKTLYFDGNGVSRIENLGFMTQLSSLYLQNNCISKIENLQNFSLLDTLNLSNNTIQHVEGLSSLKQLRRLDLTSNQLVTPQSLEGLIEAPTLRILYLKSNPIEYDPEVITVLTQLPELGTLYFQDTKFQPKCKNYRNTMISKMPELVFLDDRAVDPNERRRVNAWVKGGKEAEKAERILIAQEAKDAENEYINKQREKSELLQREGVSITEITDLERIYQNKLKMEKLSKEKMQVEEELKKLQDKEKFERQLLENENKRAELQKQKQAKEQLQLQEKQEQLDQKLVEELTAEEKAQRIKERNEWNEHEKFIKRLQRDKISPEEERQIEIELTEGRLDSINENIKARKEQIKVIQENNEKRKKGNYKQSNQYYIVESEQGDRRYINLDEKREAVIRKRDDEIHALAKKKLKEYNNKLMDRFIDDNQSRVTDSTLMSNQEQLAWDVSWESKLEELLEEKAFDFEAASEEFNRYIAQRGFDDGCIYKNFTAEKLKQQWKEVEMSRYRWDDQTQPFQPSEIPEPDLEKLGMIDLEGLDQLIPLHQLGHQFRGQQTAKSGMEQEDPTPPPAQASLLESGWIVSAEELNQIRRVKKKKYSSLHKRYQQSMGTAVPSVSGRPSYPLLTPDLHRKGREEPAVWSCGLHAQIGGRCLSRTLHQIHYLLQFRQPLQTLLPQQECA